MNKYKSFKNEIAKRHEDLNLKKSNPEDENDDSNDCLIVEEEEESEPTLAIQQKKPFPQKTTIPKIISASSIAQLDTRSPLYKCQYCTIFPSVTYDKLVIHTKTYHSYQCQYCKKTFRLSKELNIHILKDHDHRNVYTCRQCGMTGFLDPLGLEDHSQMKHNKQLFKCRDPQCILYFKSAADLRAHMVLSHPSKIVVAEKTMLVRRLEPSKAIAALKSKPLLAKPPAKKNNEFIIMEVKIDDTQVKEIKQEKMDVDQEFESNEVHVEEVTVIENPIIKMESEDQEETQSIESCSVADIADMKNEEEEAEEINTNDDEQPIEWLDKDLNLPKTFVSAVNEPEDLDDIIQSKKTALLLAKTNIRSELLPLDLVRCLDCGERMTIEKLLREFKDFF